MTNFTQPFPGGPKLFHFKVGDRVRVTLSGRTGTVVEKCRFKNHGWMVKWDEPVFGVEKGRVTTANLEPEDLT
jgi:hypothetical protein